MSPLLCSSVMWLPLAGTTLGTVISGISGLCSHGVVRFSSLVSSSYLLFPLCLLASCFLISVIFSLTSTFVFFPIGGKGLAGIKGEVIHFSVPTSLNCLKTRQISSMSCSQETSVSALVAMTCSPGGSNGTIVAIWTPLLESFSLKPISPNWHACCQRPSACFSRRNPIPP